MPMTREQVEAKIRQILIEDFQVPEDAIVAGATFRGNFRMDSLDIVDFILLLQKDFGYKVPADRYRELDSFGKLAAFVERMVGEKEQAEKSVSPRDKSGKNLGITPLDDVITSLVKEVASRK